MSPPNSLYLATIHLRQHIVDRLYGKFVSASKDLLLNQLMPKIQKVRLCVITSIPPVKLLFKATNLKPALNSDLLLTVSIDHVCLLSSFVLLHKLDRFAFRTSSSIAIWSSSPNISPRTFGLLRLLPIQKEAGRNGGRSPVMTILRMSLSLSTARQKSRPSLTS